MKDYKKVRHFGSLFLAAVVAILTLAVMVHATQVITTPNAASVSYSLAAGGNSSAITPPLDTAVLVVADQIGGVIDDVGSSLLTLVNSKFDGELVWNGFESNGGGLTAGFSPVAGTHMVFIDFAHHVDLQVNNSTSFKVHNGTGSPVRGNVTMIW